MAIIAQLIGIIALNTALASVQGTLGWMSLNIKYMISK